MKLKKVYFIQLQQMLIKFLRGNRTTCTHPFYQMFFFKKAWLKKKGSSYNDVMCKVRKMLKFTILSLIFFAASSLTGIV